MVFLLSCGIPKEEEEYEILKNENQKLKLENEKLLIKLKNNANEANQIILEIEKAYEEKEYCVVKYDMKKLKDKYPELYFEKGYEDLLTKIDSIEKNIFTTNSNSKVNSSLLNKVLNDAAKKSKYNSRSLGSGEYIDYSKKNN
jgi:cell division septum initiation protein DivIVA